MVAQLELLKQDFRELANIVKENNNVDKNYDFSQMAKFFDGDSVFKLQDPSLSEEEVLERILNDRVVKCTVRYQAIVK